MIDINAFSQEFNSPDRRYAIYQIIHDKDFLEHPQGRFSNLAVA